MSYSIQMICFFIPMKKIGGIIFFVFLVEKLFAY